ncbi:cytoplasmic dynein 1 heavy chain 1 isoform X1 [Hydra vulgaris]|uniref:cytoplasmic dynein 1 heavy chain 1 isoform X1 n=1 Tax=Hydra vulgaris TaxID=6087 RepID=UPI001F5F4CC0|nr:cytoplasmic dynein 1 heavy chain 1 isoform X1 [Hydra vulgaris]
MEESDVGEPPPNIVVASVDAVIKYLRDVSISLFEEDSYVLIDNVFVTDYAKELLKKFILESQCKSIIVYRTTSLKDEVENESAATSDYFYGLQLSVQFISEKETSIAFIKRGAVIEADKKISNQLHILNMVSSTPFDMLHSCISNAVSPFFKTYVKKSGKSDREGDKMVPSVEKKIAELEMGLLHLQQNIDIPEITLQIHPFVQGLLKKAEAEKRKVTQDDYAEKADDSTFLNSLQNQVNRWIREIQKVTKLERDPASGNALQEISFWLNLEKALHRIEDKQESPEVKLTLDILKFAKRFHAIVSFTNDTGLKQGLQTVANYNPLMKDFPLDQLLSATELERIKDALVGIFGHLKKIKLSQYPVQRCLRLIEAISKDLMSQLLKVLSTKKLMLMNYEDFEKVMIGTFSVLLAWDDEYDRLQQILRDMAKKKRDDSLKTMWRVNPSHKKLQARLDDMRKFRKQHEQLRIVILRVLRPATAKLSIEVVSDNIDEHMVDMADANAVQEVDLAYEYFKEVDPLDVTKDGNEAWETALKYYGERIDRVETRITARLRDQLGTAKNANEMFRIFSRFNALFVRPRIRGAIREYQKLLIGLVKEDIDSLHDKFKVQYPHSKASKMSKVRDLPPVSGSIIWAKEIERQLRTYLKRVEDVLGKDWENHIEGQGLKADGDNFRQKLNTQEIFDDWSQQVQQRALLVVGRLFAIDSHKTRSGPIKTILRIRVNFLKEVITLAKEVRNLKWLGFRVPLAIVRQANDANQYYPSAISLIESIRTYEITNNKVLEKPTIIPLVAGVRRDIQTLVAEGIGLEWMSYKLMPYVMRLSEAVTGYQEKVEELLTSIQKIDIEVQSLSTCAYKPEVFEEILSKIQKAVDELNLHSYSNLNAWVRSLDEQVENKLAARLQAGLKEWIKSLKKENELIDDKELAAYRPGGFADIKSMRIEFHIMNHVISVNPSVESCREHLYNEYASWVEVITGLRKIQSQRYQVGIEVHEEVTTKYRDLLEKLPDPSGIQTYDVYVEIEHLMNLITVYCKEWLNFQSLWDVEMVNVLPQLKTLENWMDMLGDIKASRHTFDTAETFKEFGPIIIDFNAIQTKVNLKYDTLQKAVVQQFGTRLGEEISDFFVNVSKARSDLEQQSLEVASTAEAVTFITYVQGLKRKIKLWEKSVMEFREGQKILERQRYQFPTFWLYSDNVDGEWGAFNDILKRKDSAIQNQISTLQHKIIAEDQSVEERTYNLLVEWEKEKPVSGVIKSETALNTLAIFEGKFNRLKEDRDNIQKAKEALELIEIGNLPPSEERVQVAIEELVDFKSVWSELDRVWSQLDALKEQTWVSVLPRKLRQSLDNIANGLKLLPARMRQYAAFDYVQKIIKGYLKVNVLIVELKSEALKERHWKQLTRKLNVKLSFTDLTLGQIWDCNLEKNELIVKDVISVAQGELALEEFLKQVKEAWQSFELELVSYQNRCKLIRSWDELFDKVKEHINSVSAMKLSPYYKVFEEDAVQWEDKLNRILNLFDVWIDVQRRWVYLDGIFSGSGDIQHLLPIETQRFGSISSEFLTLMRKVGKAPLVLDILNIPGVQRILERLGDLLGKIQKALGEYLERERASFPRFYFVGDEDLLEIIGNSKNVGRLQKHFKKMFAGIHTISLNADSTVVNGICSKEGEEVHFITPVSLIDFPKINEWLSKVEEQMRLTLATLLARSIKDIQAFSGKEIDTATYMNWVDKYQAQLVILSAQIFWSEQCENALVSIPNGDTAKIHEVLAVVEKTLNILADSVLQEQPVVRRLKLEQLITELVHQRDVTRMLIKHGTPDAKSFQWLSQMRFYFDPKQKNVLEQLSICMANAKFNYGFEYLGIQEKLVQTPLTDRCYLTMTQALEGRLGGSPFGPAGTGKTESVKALGNQLGKFVLVFNCDENFDFQAMGRIFIGLCQVGAWGCFDEFNRLEERMLSAVSQQIQTIQIALKQGCPEPGVPITIQLIGKEVKVSEEMAIFITMNPGYAGRSNLPDNLKKLFRSLAMTTPDRQLISQVMLYSQGFRTAEVLAGKVVPFFKLCREQLSCQSHYDFGLRALKSVLISAGNVKREKILQLKKNLNVQEINETRISENLNEQEIIIQSICETMIPKLIAEDIPLIHSLLADVFPGVKYVGAEMSSLRNEIMKVCKEMYLVYGENVDSGALWVEKVLQLYQISCIHHGLMMVGPSGSGKSMAWKVLLKALERYEGVQGVAHVIDPKAISKEDLYGVLDPNTREWSDGLFTHTLRKIIDNVRGELTKRQWIIFDGDVDPEWVENLNSVLDNTKLLTLPNGERLSIPHNVRIMFEVQDLKYATLATVSRCGMVWFSHEVVSSEMIVENYLSKIKNVLVEESEDDYKNKMVGNEVSLSPTLQVQRNFADCLTPYLVSNGLVLKTIEFASTKDHIMDFTKMRALSSLFSILNQGLRNILNYNHQHPDFPMSSEQFESYVPKYLVYALVWCMAGDSKLSIRQELSDYIHKLTTIPLPSSQSVIIDYEVTMNGDWVPWSNKVPHIEIETHKVASPDVVVPTLDTVRHESLLYTWLAEHKPLLLCGPPGSGKTMTLFAALRALPDMEVVGLNFSSATTPELILKTFDHYCEYRRTPNGIVLSPVQIGKWLILFCDEINLPDMDQYGTQRVISFLRQLVEQNGFYRTSDHQWVSLEKIQFVGACNPPTDPGRKPLSHRFLRHVPVVYVDYPGPSSLAQIYGTFNRAMLKLVPSLRGFANPLTDAMVELYTLSQSKFTQEMQPHYIYSPREMTRWVRGILEAIKPLDDLSVEGLVRLWAHEALRLFHDRLISDEERRWTNTNINLIAKKHFPNIDCELALKRPILYSNWLTKDYVPVDQEQLRDFTKARLKVFYEEELDVPLVLFDEVLDHVLRIDRIFRQPQGHLLLIGVSGAGKTTLSRFVAWMNGLSVVQVKVHRKYTAEDFDEDLRIVLRRSGCRNEKIAFIMDESNILDSSFLERMNTLLANGEVPGLFEGDEYSTLITQCKEGSQRAGLMLDSAEELYKWFTQQVMINLHVVLTMNPSSEGLKSRASTSPALFNRCVLNWFGDWSTGALYQVGQSFTSKVDLERSGYKPPDYLPLVYKDLQMPPSHRDVIVNAMVFVHQTLHATNESVSARGGHTVSVTPRSFLDFIHQYIKLFNEKRSDLEEQQLHLNVGLQKIRDTVSQVEELQKSLSMKSQELEAKNALANQKLKQMVKDQQEAEKKRVTSTELQSDLMLQTEQINIKKELIMTELAEVEPALQDAKTAVKSIKKDNLDEVRRLGNPPPAIKLALESICILLGTPSTDWKDIRVICSKATFIPSIVNFSTDSLTLESRKQMAKYISNPDYTFEKVNKASVACGPLVKWAIAQVNYATMLQKVEPLRNELFKSEEELLKNKSKLDSVAEMISELERSIAQYKEEYALLISEAQTIKADLVSVEAKVSRSTALLRSLSTERKRWESTSSGFQTQMDTVAGDVLLCSAFLAYGGYFDQQVRSRLWSAWTSHLEQASIQFRDDLARTEYLSTADDRLFWQSKSLPADDLCTENAVMLKRHNRYPLIIDPSGQATEFILQVFADKKITKTSFLDDAFRKNLESALRFGNPLLVQDVESYDPILNPVLNKELRRTGGRVLITLGDQDIDLSPAFTIFLSTRDPTIDFPPDLCSRVTFVNFTVTRSSLQSQCLNEVLKAERPEVDAKRSDLLKLQGEFNLRLRHLEKALLQALNDSKGSILDDDKVITTLETLKTEAAEITEKVAKTDKVMIEVEAVTDQYRNLASACSSIFFTLEGLHVVHFMYQYSLKFFLEIFQSVLYNNPKLKDKKDPTTRLHLLIECLFQSVYDRVSMGLLHDDRIAFGMLIARIRLKGQSQPNYDVEFDHFLRGKEIVVQSESLDLHGFSLDQKTALLRLSKFKPFKDILKYLSENEKEFNDFVCSQNPYDKVPKCWVESEPLTPSGEVMYKMLVLQALRPDNLHVAMRGFVLSVLGNNFLHTSEQEIDLIHIVENEIKASTPMILCSAPGYDVSSRVDDLVALTNKQITSIAIGSAEGFSDAEKAINASIKSGKWVLLKNVHLATQWLVSLEKRLHSLQPHPNFRLFMTMEINPKVPVNLLRASRIFVFEPPPGIKANLLRTFSTISSSRMSESPAERPRLYFLLAWFHAIVQERLRYTPLGWSKLYEFNESDLRVAFDMLDTWIASVSQNRANIAPEKLPWDAFSTLLGQSIYGGRIDNDFDQRLIQSFIERVFTLKSFDSEFPLVSTSSKDIVIPDVFRREQFIQWCESLPDYQPPSWLGLPNNAEKVILTNLSEATTSKILKMRLTAEDDELAYVPDEQKMDKGLGIDVRPQWMKDLHQSVKGWLHILPDKILAIKRTVENIKDPLYRFFEREINVGVKLLTTVRNDLGQVIDVCEGNSKQTNDLRNLIDTIVKGIIPKSWNRFTFPEGLTVIQWVVDLSERMKQLQSISRVANASGAKELRNIKVWLGGLFIPEAYITATRQYIAQANQWSLEELYLKVSIVDDFAAIQSVSDSGFVITGLKLQGATCLGNKLQIADTMMTDLPETSLHWIKMDSMTLGKTKVDGITLPVYLNQTRKDLLFTVDMESNGDVPKRVFYERGVAFISSNLSG